MFETNCNTLGELKNSMVMKICKDDITINPTQISLRNDGGVEIKSFVKEASICYVPEAMAQKLVEAEKIAEKHDSIVYLVVRNKEDNAKPFGAIYAERLI
jgi:hypothetical protein